MHVFATFGTHTLFVHVAESPCSSLGHGAEALHACVHAWNDPNGRQSNPVQSCSLAHESYVAPVHLFTAAGGSSPLHAQIAIGVTNARDTNARLRIPRSYL